LLFLIFRPLQLDDQPDYEKILVPALEFPRPNEHNRCANEGYKRATLIIFQKTKLKLPIYGGVKKMASKSKIRPLHDRLIVERLEGQDKTASGLYIPDSAKEKPQTGRVIAVGKGRIKEDGKVTPLDIKAGDTILFGKYSGTEVKLDGTEFLIMREEDVLGVVE
jgi:chaperonin GroES